MPPSASCSRRAGCCEGPFSPRGHVSRASRLRGCLTWTLLHGSHLHPTSSLNTERGVMGRCNRKSAAHLLNDLFRLFGGRSDEMPALHVDHVGFWSGTRKPADNRLPLSG